MARILIAEDEMLLAVTLKMNLHNIGHEVLTTVKSGKKAIQQAKVLHPDIILMDISMDNRTDGIYACIAIKDENPHIKIFFITAYPLSEYASSLKEVNYDGYFEKPVDLKHLKQVLSN